MRQMRIVVSHYGGPDELRVVEEECPEPKDGEVRVRVLAAGISLPDLSNPSSSATKPKAAVESERLHLSLKRATAQAAVSSQHCANTCSDATRCAAGPSRRDVGRAFGCGRVCNTRPTLARAGLAPQSAPWFSKVSSVWFAAVPGP